MTAPSPENEAQDRAIRRALLVALMVLGALVLTAVALSRSGLDAGRVEALLTRTRPGPLLGAMAIMTGGMTFMALRWRALIPDGRGLPAAGLTAIVCAGLLLNYALPGPVGELAVALLVNRRYGTAVAPALAAGIHSRFIGLAVAGVIAGAVWTFGRMPVPEQYAGLIGFTAIAIGVGATALGVLSARPRLLRAASSRTAGALGTALPGWPGQLMRRADRAVGMVADALGEVGRLGPRAYAEAIVWAICGHLSVATGIWVGSLAMGMDPYPPGVMFTYCAATAGVVALFAVPGGQLGWDAMFWSFFTVTTGVDVADALAVTALVRIQQVMLLLIGGGALTLLGAQRRR
ncbi:MAG: flippase-like domain-containing protein [Alphaproteobacteria bacterium]|nr:flippase-like domain-containing protein [Alphaproteobacteria bacterium]